MAVLHNFPKSFGHLILCQVIQIRKEQLLYNICVWREFWLFWLGLLMKNNHNYARRNIRVVQSLKIIIPWCTNAPLYFHLPTFLSTMSHGKIGVWDYEGQQWPLKYYAVDIYIYIYIYIYISKVGDLSWGWLECSIFGSYYTKA